MLLTLATELIEKCLSPLHPHEVFRLRRLCRQSHSIITSIVSTHSFADANLLTFLDIPIDIQAFMMSLTRSAAIPLYMRQVQSINWSHLNIYYYTAMIILGQRAPMVSLEMFTDPSNCPFKSRVIGTPTKSFDRLSPNAVAISRALISAFDIYDLKLAKAPRDTFSWIYIVDDLPFLQRLLPQLETITDPTRFDIDKSADLVPRYNSISILRFFLENEVNIDTVNILQESFAGGHIEPVELLLEFQRYTLDSEFITGCAIYGKVEMLEWAMSRSAISADQSVLFLALWNAAQFGHVSMVEFLLENSKVAGEEVKVEAAQAVLNSNLVHMLVDEPKKRERILALLWGKTVKS